MDFHLAIFALLGESKTTHFSLQTLTAMHGRTRAGLINYMTLRKPNIRSTVVCGLVAASSAKSSRHPINGHVKCLRNSCTAACACVIKTSTCV